MSRIISKTQKSQQGFTLMEIVVAMGIMVIIGVLGTYFARDITDSTLRVNRSLLTQQQLQQTLQLMVPEIRSASQSNDGSYPIVQATTSTFTFFSDIDQDGDFDRVRYFLNGTNLDKGVISPSGVPLSYPTSTETLRTLVENMVASQIFTYYGETATSTQSVPLPFPVNVLAIKTVEVTLVANQGTTSTPAFVGVKNQATIRNLRYK
jgi:prepilin-type N-terminal cleavage/methylation domain-containing protein